MSVSLKKGQKVSLTKENAGLRRVVVGLGWDAATPSSQGFLSGLFGGGKVENIDCDAMAFLLDADGKIAAGRDVIFYNNLQHPSGAVVHQGDNLTGEGDGDDEQIVVDLSKLPAQCERIVILVSIYQANERKQHFGMIRNAFIRLVNADDNRELCIYNLSEHYDGMTAMVFGELYRYKGEWKFNAVGQPLQIWSVSKLSERYGLPSSYWKQK